MPIDFVFIDTIKFFFASVLSAVDSFYNVSILRLLIFIGH